ncbi:MAG: Molybdopterin oxidoreductase [Cytophagales bacterium]|jgi:molybdopterin-containing oxidoreductase family membrane subunit|nr:polysulfide reductase NrfD [Bacteroidota bacterium]MBS1950733.1 polysulfide reductase NrfD [Bacteroidota bacterium]MBS1980707.1 polysulfide reductase NrfD [Bacteroidota bacterium]WHZ08040.1 MAG: Molybdopterin oxidoreductase [Cytophagales bacterium]
MNTAYDQLVNDLAPKKFGWRGNAWMIFLMVIIIAGVYSYIQQLRQGLSVTGMRDYALWGIYISNFVFFVAVSLVGSLITAILRLSNVHWNTPLTRIAEIVAVAAIIMAGLTIIIDMGRPDRMLNLFAHGRLQSPIIWDVIVISTYLVISLMLLYYPLLPDFSILSNYFQKNTRLSKWYGRLSLNWTGTDKQRRIYSSSIQALSILIIPVAFAIHTVTAWLFETTYRPGWDSTNFGPYFIAGAFVAGTSAVIIVMFVLCRVYSLEKYITDEHCDMMGKILVLLCLVYLYFNLNEYMMPTYKSTEEEAVHLRSLFTGQYARLFWTAIIGGLVVPVIVLVFPQGRKPVPLFIVSLAVVLGAWWKRYIIVIPTLSHPFLPIQGVPESWRHYSPTWMEWSITFATLASALLIITLLVRFLPIIPIHETAEERNIVESPLTNSL